MGAGGAWSAGYAWVLTCHRLLMALQHSKFTWQRLPAWQRPPCCRRCWRSWPSTRPTKDSCWQFQSGCSCHPATSSSRAPEGSSLFTRNIREQLWMQSQAQAGAAAATAAQPRSVPQQAQSHTGVANGGPSSFIAPVASFPLAGTSDSSPYRNPLGDMSWTHNELALLVSDSVSRTSSISSADSRSCSDVQLGDAADAAGGTGAQLPSQGHQSRSEGLNASPAINHRCRV